MKAPLNCLPCLGLHHLPQSLQALGALGLIKANEDGRLSGKLKEIADNLDEGDNPVLMIMKFKKE